MKDKYILTAESVTAGHPDKLCDTIADSILDACLKEDPNARVACEVLATAGKILVAGELRTTASPDVEAIVRQTVRNAGYDCNYHVEVRLHTQSPCLLYTSPMASMTVTVTLLPACLYACASELMARILSI